MTGKRTERNKQESSRHDELEARARRALDDHASTLADQLLDGLGGLGGLDAPVAELVEGLRIYQAELEIQNRELRDAQGVAQQALARYTTLFAGNPLALLVVDRSGLILEANDSAGQLFGLARMFHEPADDGRCVVTLS